MKLSRGYEISKEPIDEFDIRKKEFLLRKKIQILAQEKYNTEMLVDNENLAEKKLENFDLLNKCDTNGIYFLTYIL